MLTVYAQAATDFVALDVSGADLLQALANALVASLLAWLWMTRWLARRLGGFTGDCLGAIQQVCELAFYLGLALSL